MGFYLILFLITAICLIPFSIALSYFVIGLKNYFTGKKEKSRVKIISGSNAAILSLMGMTGVFFFWMMLCRIFLSWEL